MTIRRVKKMSKRVNEDNGAATSTTAGRATASSTDKMADAMVGSPRFRSLLLRLLRDEMLVKEMVAMIQPGVKDVLVSALKHADVKLGGGLASKAKAGMRKAVSAF